MIKHIYLFRLKDKAKLPEVAAKLKTLKAHVPEICELEIGVDFSHAENSFDLCEYVTFASMDDFRIFRANAYHDGIRKYMADMQEIGVKIDYESEEAAC